jgi:DNA polymerase-3 subunit delta
LSPEQFLQRIAKGEPSPVYLFLGPEAYQRRICRSALIDRALGADRGSGYERYDLDETPLVEVLDDARSMSLFANNRVIWVASAEAALPKRLTADADESGQGAALAGYLRNPSPGVVVVFDAARFDFEGEDRAKLERVQKFYAAVREVVEFRPYAVEAARRLAQELAREAGLRIGIGEIGLLVEALAGDASRIANEIEKLRLYAGSSRKIEAEDILRLVPNAPATTIFALVASIGRGDRRRSLESLDTLIREGEYLPLALTFLATQFRLAMAAHEAGLRNTHQIQAHFTKEGIRIWRDRAEQVNQTVNAFTKRRLAAAIARVYQADKALRDARPDDRVVMEELVLNLTK